MFTLTQDNIRRFWEKVNIQDDKDACWYWDEGYSISSGGYGRMTFAGRVWHSNQLAWMFYNEEKIPDKMLVLHSSKCVENAEKSFKDGKKSRLCCNPYHLRLGTHKDNSKDTKEQGRMKGVFEMGRKGDAGENHPRHKLTKIDVMSIMSDNRTHKSIAKDFKVNPSTITRIKNGLRWKEG